MDPPVLELWGATLFDGLQLQPSHEMVVEILSDRVVAVRAGPPRGGGEIRDLRGQFLIPGLFDVHAHAEQPWVFAALDTMGVTAIRNPATAPAGSRDDLAAPAVCAAGPAIDGPASTNPHTVRVGDAAALTAEIRRQAAAGFDAIKLYQQLCPELVRVGVAAAHDAGLPAIGDLVATSWTEAARAGIDFLCHGVPRHPDLLPASARQRYHAELRAGRCHPYLRWLELVDVDGPEIDEMIAALAQSDVAVDPTLVSLEAMLRCGDPEYHAAIAGGRSLLPEALRAGDQPPALAPDTIAELRRQAGAAWHQVLRLIGRLHRGGIRLLAGTDTPRPFVVPGASLHRELALLCQAGLSAHEALRSATGIAATALGLERERGTIAPGRRADLIALRRDPLAAIENTTSIAWVMTAGTIVSPT